MKSEENVCGDNGFIKEMNFFVIRVASQAYKYVKCMYEKCLEGRDQWQATYYTSSDYTGYPLFE